VGDGAPDAHGRRAYLRDDTEQGGKQAWFVHLIDDDEKGDGKKIRKLTKTAALEAAHRWVALGEK
jgi:hypothetical protein